MTENKNDVGIICNKVIKFTVVDSIFLLFSACAVFLDQLTDLFLVIEYFYFGYSQWAVITLVLVAVSACVVQVISLRWHFGEGSCTTRRKLAHLFSLGLVLRYFSAMKLGLKSNRTRIPSDYLKFLSAQNDLSVLFLFKSFLQSAPQLVVQLYFLASVQPFRLFTCISALSSVISLALSMLCYPRAQAKTREPLGGSGTQCGALSLWLQMLWRLGMLTARVAALLILLLVFQAWFLLFIGVHWASMFVWIVYQKTDSCDLQWEERCYNAVAAVIYCFCFFNLKDGPSRWRLLSYYSLVTFQNLTCLTVFLMFYHEASSRIGVAAFTAILGGTLIGAANIILYYRLFHPSGPIDVCKQVPCDPINASGRLRSLKRLSRSTPSLGNVPSPAHLKVPLSDSIVIVEESDMEDIRILHKWRKEVTPLSAGSLTDSKPNEYGVLSAGPGEDGSVELLDTASSKLSAHDYENLAGVNIARNGRLRTWTGYCDIDTFAHDDSIGRDGHTNTTSTSTASQQYLDSIADDYVDCKASSLHTIPEESQSNCSETSRGGCDGACTLVATIDQIRRGTPVLDPYLHDRRTFSLPPPPPAPWAPSPPSLSHPRSLLT